MGDDKVLLGKVAIVTGGAAGLGRDIAASLIAAGASAVLAGRNAEAGAEAEGLLGPAAMFVQTDITDDRSIARCIEVTGERFGRLDILVNNACDYRDPGPAASRADWTRSLDVNLVSGAIFASLALPRFIEAGGGVVINVASVGGKFGRRGSILYPAAKAAILQITKNQAVSWAEHNVRVLAVSPAWTWSDAVAGLAGTVEQADRIGARLHPRGRIGRGEDVGRVVAFACSSAADFMTGIDLPVDGGFSVLGPDQGLSPAAWLKA